MKISQAAFVATIGVAFVDVASAASLRSLSKGVQAEKVPAANEPLSTEDNEEGRKLSWCNTDDLEEKWHPQYSQGWAGGSCKLGKDCNSEGYSTELACCQGAYAGQVSGHCLMQLPEPPTTSPTETGGLDVYYPDYGTAWPEAHCINERPLPSGRPTYDSMLACCKGAYAGQTSGACLAALPEPPTVSPTPAGGLDVYYPDYGTAWPDAYCINDRPLPSGRPAYDSMLECCKGSYGGQTSGKCLSMLPEPPTTSPTPAGGADFWYPRYDETWSEAGCSNELPLPFNTGDRPTYDTQLECCKGAYGGQASGKCLSELPEPPTGSPTQAGGVGSVYYPDYDTAWSDATCKNDLPLPFNAGDRPTYDTMLACCKATYGGQASGKCLAALPSPPTAAPTSTEGLEVYYPDYTKAWPEGVCINERPLPSGRPAYSSQEACCSGAYGGQVSQKCMCDADVCHSCSCEGDKSGCDDLECEEE